MEESNARASLDLQTCGDAELVGEEVTIHEDGDGNGQSKPAKTETFRKFRELLMIKRYETYDTVPTFVANGLFIGSLGAAINLESLQNEQITHILCVSASLPLRFPDQFTYMRLALADLPSTQLDDAIPQAVDFIDTSISGGGRVLVHCFVGKSRSASMVLAYLMARHGMSLDAAMELLKCARPQVQPNSGFLSQLRSFEQKLAIQSALVAATSIGS